LKKWFFSLKEDLELDKKIKKEYVIDKKSSNYLKTKSLVEKYSLKLKELDKEAMKNILVFIIPTKKNLIKKEHFSLRKKVIKQNISILQAKLK
jgi:hypothetical protein